MTKHWTGEEVLVVENVSLRLGSVQVLERLSFTVLDRLREGTVTGQVAALLGPSGVGKTRLLRIIAGLDAPDAGSVLGLKREPLPVGSVGVVFQDYPLLRHRTIAGNLALAARVGGLGGKEGEARVAQLLDTFGLADRANYYPWQLSGGQRQRVAIAQQLVIPRRLLLLDEPFSGLDPVAVKRVCRLITEVANLDQLNTVVVVTHDVRSAMTVSDTLLMLGRDRDDGKVTSGARIQATYDLAERGLAWREDVELLPEFATLEREICETFSRL